MENKLSQVKMNSIIKIRDVIRCQILTFGNKHPDGLNVCSVLDQIIILYVHLHVC